MKNKVLNVGIEVNEYEKFCKENGLEPEHKMSKLRFASTKNEDAKELLEKIENGEVKIEEVEFVELNPKEVNKDFAKGIKSIFEGIAYLTGNKEKLNEHPFYELDEGDKSRIACAFMNAWSEEMIAIFNSITKASMAFGFVNYMKGKRDKDDKKA